jgi:hypothetical protein
MLVVPYQAHQLGTMFLLRQQMETVRPREDFVG